MFRNWILFFEFINNFFFHFKYQNNFGEFCIKKFDHSLGAISNDGDSWQLTVYSKDYTTPDWLDGGIIYQIFPDRFYNSGKTKKNIPADRYICDDWSKDPVFTPQKESDGVKYLGNDYYGGDLKGITEKLEYIHSLGVSCIYLNPIFEAHSNHRYNTADYMKIDPMLGEEKDLISLIKKAEKTKTQREMQKLVDNIPRIRLE